MMSCRPIGSLHLKVFEYLTGAALFEIYESSSVMLADVHLERMIELLGPFPLNFLAACSRREVYFNDQGVFSIDLPV